MRFAWPLGILLIMGAAGGVRPAPAPPPKTVSRPIARPDSSPEVLYVTQAGSDDTGSGTIARPFRTIHHTLRQVTQPTLILIGDGVYTEAITLAADVTPTAVTIQSMNASADDVIIDASSDAASVLVADWGAAGDLQIKNLTLTGGLASDVVRAGGDASFRTLRLDDCTIDMFAGASEGVHYEAGLAAAEIRVQGCTFVGATTRSSIRIGADLGLLRVADCTFEPGTKNAIQFSRDVHLDRGARAINNTYNGVGWFFDVGVNTPIVLTGGDVKLAGNTMTTGRGFIHVTRGGPGAVRWTIADNFVETNQANVAIQIGTDVASQSGTLDLGPVQFIGNTVVSNNSGVAHLCEFGGRLVDAEIADNAFITNANNDYGVVVKAQGGFPNAIHIHHNTMFGIKSLHPKGARNCLIEHNSVFSTAGFGIGINVDNDGAEPAGLTVRDNIFVSAGPAISVGTPTLGAAEDWFTQNDFNLYDRTTPGAIAKLEAVLLNDLADLQAVWPLDAHSLQGDPQFVFVGGNVNDNWNVLPESPAIGAASNGQNVGAMGIEP